MCGNSCGVRPRDSTARPRATFIYALPLPRPAAACTACAATTLQNWQYRALAEVSAGRALACNSSQRICYRGSDQRVSGSLSGCDHQAAPSRVTLPSVLNIFERNPFRLDMELPFCGVCHDLLKGVDQNF